jgi:hypothetical protein
VLNRDRRNYLSKTALVAQLASEINLEVEPKNSILVAFRFFEFSHSQGQTGKAQCEHMFSGLPPKANITLRTPISCHVWTSGWQGPHIHGTHACRWRSRPRHHNRTHPQQQIRGVATSCAARSTRLSISLRSVPKSIDLSERPWSRSQRPTLRFRIAIGRVIIIDHLAGWPSLLVGVQGRGGPGQIQVRGGCDCLTI